MKFSPVAAAAIGCPKNHRAAQPASGPAAQTGRVTGNLFHGCQDKSGKLELHDGYYALAGQPDTDTGQHAFGQRCINDPICPKACQQTFGDTKYSALGGYIFAQKNDVLVIGHGVVQSAIERIDHGFRHLLCHRRLILPSVHRALLASRHNCSEKCFLAYRQDCAGNL